MMKHFRLMTAALCAAFLLCGMTAPAYAYSDEPTGGYEETDPAPTDEDATVEEAPAPEPTIEPGEGFSEAGQFVTRDLLYDENTNKQFITVQTKGGSTFYLVIDYDKPVDEEGEQYETYFLGMVDEADLLAAFEETGGELPTCSCTEKCAAGAVNTACPVCATNMTECAGVEPGKVFPHNLRHLFARTYYSLEKDLSRLADILGHSSVNTTRIYTVESGAVHARQLERMGLVLTT